MPDWQPADSPPSDEPNPLGADKERRKVIPSVDDLGTKFRPVFDFVMVVELAGLDKIGEIWIPDSVKSRQQVCEGHIVAKGPGVSDAFEVGDYISWGMNHSNKMEVDDSKPFVLVKQAAIIMQIKKKDL